jgi:indoleamine 2,3-dioxygenase
MYPISIPHNGPNGYTVTPRDICVDPRTGFVPPEMPLWRLPDQWEMWEAALDAAKSQKLKAAEQALLLDGQQKTVEEGKARAWRETVEKVWMEAP